METSSPVKFQNLDALRFLAFFAVFVNHAVNSLGHKSSNVRVEVFKYKFLANGDLGVSFFFVLSGFLITYLLLREKSDRGRIHVPHFYMRRILRIWPLYFFVLLICLIFIPALQSSVHGAFPLKIATDKLNPWLYVSFLGNFDFIYHGISNSVVSVLWSVSVEEQFYLFWPLLIALLPGKYLGYLFSALILFSICYRYAWSDGKNVALKFHTFSSISDLSTGALLAWLSGKEKWRAIFESMPRWLITLIYVGGILLFLNRFHIGMNKPWKMEIAALLPFLFSLFFGFVIAEQNFAKRSLLKMSRLKLVSELGKYTYGMYCYHMIVFFFLFYFWQLSGRSIFPMDKYEWLGFVLSGFLLTVLISKVSYVYFEQRFLRFKSRFGA